jgi:hypothetical protein
MTTQGHHPHSPYLALSDVYQFPRLKSALKVWCLCDAIGIIKNATDELKSFLLNGFQKGLQYTHSFRQKFIAAKWKYFEENVVLTFRNLASYI